MILAIVLQGKPPFEQDQVVDLYAYEGGSPALDELHNREPYTTMKGVITRPYDLPLVRIFGGYERWFLPFEINKSGEFMLAAIYDKGGPQ